MEFTSFIWYFLVLIALLCNLNYIECLNTTSSAMSSTTKATQPLPTTVKTRPPPTTPSPATKPPVTSGALPVCGKRDMKYEYTECDASGGRWRVGVPAQLNSCILKNPPIPQRGKSCSFSCEEGKYLNINTQECSPCLSGTYSLNGGIRVTAWNKIPSGFQTWGRDPDDVSSPVDSTENMCSSYTWKAKGQYVESAGDYCKSILSYSATLIKEGNVSFTYRSNSDMAYFHIKVVNNWCTTSNKGNHHFFPDLSSKWKTVFIRLKPGLNIIFWEAAFFYEQDYVGAPDATTEDGETTKTGESESTHRYDSSSERSVQIKDIEITGLSFTSQCTKCPAGTYSKDQAAECKECSRDTFSTEGSATCSQCPTDEYAEKGSSSCKKRPRCTERDYYGTWSTCSKGKTQKSFTWIEPKICNSNLPKSLALPKGNEKIDCPPCNPGQFKNGSECSYCPAGEFSDGKSDKCTPCPVNTTPEKGLYFVWWHAGGFGHLHAYCLSRTTRSCVTNQGWIPGQNHLSSGIGHADDAELVLFIRVPKFTSHYAHLVMQFELICESKCRLQLEEHENDKGNRAVQTWYGTVSKTKFIYDLKSRNGTRFRISFEKPYVSEEQSFKYTKDRAIIYVLNITHADNGGADRCTPCTVENDKNGCVRCKSGYYVNKNTKKCVPCPAGTYWSHGKHEGAEACIKCPKGTISTAGSSRCYSDCKLKTSKGVDFDFSPLAGTVGMMGEKQFTSRAFPYYHYFNVSVCGSPAGSSCFGVQKNSQEGNGKTNVVSVHSSICRSYCYSEDNGKLCAQAMDLGEQLVSIYVGDPFHSNSSTEGITLDSGGEVNDTLPTDVSFYFKSSTITPRCPQGFSTLVTMRCDPGSKDKGYLRPPKKCSHGTCNGCLFHLFWHSPIACPICTHLDYDNITSACKDGLSTVRHIWHFPKMCRDGVALPSDVTRRCSIFEKSILDFKIFILIFLGLAVLLVIAVLVLCYRNRRLTYKYHRLIDTTAVKNGELPAAERCTLEEGEEDEEEVILSKNGRSGRRILDRLKKTIASPVGRNDFTEFETINLTEYGNKVIDDFD